MAEKVRVKKEVRKILRISKMCIYYIVILKFPCLGILLLYISENSQESFREKTFLVAAEAEGV